MRKRSIMRQITATVSAVVLAVGMVPSYALPVVYAEQTTTTSTASVNEDTAFPVMTEFSASSQAYELKDGADKLVLNVKANASEGRTIKRISVGFRKGGARIYNTVEFEEVPSDGIYKVELPVTGYNPSGNYCVAWIKISDSRGYATMYRGAGANKIDGDDGGQEVTQTVYMDEPQSSYTISVVNPTGDNNPPILESVLYNGQEQLEITDVTQTVDVAIGVKDDDSDSNAFASGVKEIRLMWNQTNGLSMTDFKLAEDGKYHSTLSFNQGIESVKLQLFEIDLVDNAGNMSIYNQNKESTESDYIIWRIFSEKINNSYINITNKNEDKEIPVLKDYILKDAQDKYVKSKIQDWNNPIKLLVAAEDANSGLERIYVDFFDPNLEELDGYSNYHGVLTFGAGQDISTKTIDGVEYYVVPLRYNTTDDMPAGEYVIRSIDITDQMGNTVRYENKDILNNEYAKSLEKIISFQVVDDSEDTTGPTLESIDLEVQTQIIEDENMGTRVSIMYDTVITDDLAGYSMKSIRVWLKDSNGNVRGSYGSKTYNGKSDESYTSVISLEPYWLLDGTWRISKVAISDIVGNETTYYNAKDYPNETNKINFSDSNPDGEFTLTNPETDDKTGPVLKSLDLDKETSIVTYESDGSTRVAINYTSNVTDDGVGYRSGYDKIYLKKSFDGTGSGSCSSRRIGNNGDSYDSQIGLRPYSFSDGIWRVSRIVVSDKVGNETTYYNAVDYPDEANKINFSDSNPRGEFTLTNPETDDKTGPVLKSLDLDKETSIVTYGNDGSITLAIDYTSIITDDEVGYISGADKIYLKNSYGKESGYWGSRRIGNNGDSYNSQIRIAPYKLSNGVWRISKIIVSDKVGNETTYYNAVDYPDEANKINFSDSNPRGEFTLTNPETDDKTGPVLKSLDLDKETSIVTYESDGSTRVAINYTSNVTDDGVGYRSGYDKIYLKNSYGKESGYWGSRGIGNNGDSYDSQVGLQPYNLSNGVWRISKIIVSDKVGNETTYYNAVDYPDEANKINFTDSNPRGEFTLTNPETDDKTGPVLKSLDLDKETSIVTYESDGSTRVAINYTSNVTDDGVGYRSGYDKIYLKKSFDGTGSGSCSSRRIGNNGDSYDSQIGLQPYSFSDGIWRVSRIVVSDKVGNETTYYNAVDYPDEANKINFTDSNPRGEFVITNPEDKIAPVLEEFSIISSTDITVDKDDEAKNFITYKMKASDDVSGIITLRVRITYKDSSGRLIGGGSSSFRYVNNKDDENYGYYVGKLPVYYDTFALQSGEYSIANIQVIDRAGNTSYYYTGESEELNEIVGKKITVSYGDDKVAPVLNKFEITKTDDNNVSKVTVGLGSADVNIPVVVNATDADSKMYKIEYYLRRQSTNGIWGTYSFGSKMLKYDNVDYSTGIYVSSKMVTDTYMIDRMILKDNAGNEKVYYNNEISDYKDKTDVLPEKACTWKLQVKNTDTTNPVLNDFYFGEEPSDETTINTSDLEGRIKWTANVTDDNFYSVRFSLRNIETGRTVLTTGRNFNQAEDKIYSYESDISEFKIPSGRYELAYVDISDRGGNRVKYDNIKYYPTTKNILQESIASRIIVINNADSDNTPPEYKSITLDSKKDGGQINIESLPIAIKGKLEATDDKSGVNKVYISVSDDNNQKYSFVSNVEQDGSFTLRLDESLQKGTYTLKSLTVYDVAGNKTVVTGESTPAYTFIVGKNDSHMVTEKVDADDVNLVTAIIESVAEKISIDCTQNTVIGSDVMDALKEVKNKVIALETKAAQWVFNSDEVSRGTKSLDLSVNTSTPTAASTDEVEKQIADKVGEDATAVRVELGENGTLPGKAKVRVKVDDKLAESFKGADKGLYIYYYDTDAKKMKLITEGVKVTADQCIELPIMHCSDYVITDKKIEDAIKELLGDADGNGAIDSLDVVALLKAIVGLSKVDPSLADVNCDGAVNTADAVAILQYIVGAYEIK